MMKKIIVSGRERETETETETETERQRETERDRDRQTETDRQTESGVVGGGGDPSRVYRATTVKWVVSCSILNDIPTM